MLKFKIKPRVIPLLNTLTEKDALFFLFFLSAYYHVSSTEKKIVNGIDFLNDLSKTCMICLHQVLFIINKLIQTVFFLFIDSIHLVFLAELLDYFYQYMFYQNTKIRFMLTGMVLHYEISNISSAKRLGILQSFKIPKFYNHKNNLPYSKIDEACLMNI